MKRALAVVAAVVMVIASLAIRGTFSDDGGGGSDGGGGGGSAPSDLTIACPPELTEPCRQAFGDRVVTQQAGVTLDQIGTGELEVDAWLVSRPWADVAKATAAEEIDSITTTGAQSPIVIAVWSDRREALADGCGVEFGLECLGIVAGQSFSDLGASFPESVSVGYTNLSTMTGFDVVSAGASSYFGVDNYASNDFDTAFRTWLGDFQRDASGTGDQLGSMFTIGPPQFTAVVGTEAALSPIYTNAAKRDQVELLATPSSSDLVVVDFAGGPDSAGTATDDDLLAALAEAGWRVPGRDEPAGLPTTDDAVVLTGESTDGMAVRDGVLAALRTLAQSTS